LAKPEFFLKSVSPSGAVPALYYDGKHCINEPDVCCEFIDSMYSGGTALAPGDPILAAKMRMAMKAVDVFSFYKLLMNQGPAKGTELAASSNLRKAARKVRRAYLLAALTARMPYVLGESISLTGALITPFLDRFRYLPKYYRGHDLILPGSKAGGGGLLWRI
jgi:glutathione S-transferase